LGVEIDQETDGARRLPLDIRNVGGKKRPGFDSCKVRRKFGLKIGGIFERKAVGIGFDEEIERIDHGHLRREIDFDLQL